MKEKHISEAKKHAWVNLCPPKRVVRKKSNGMALLTKIKKKKQ